MPVETSYREWLKKDLGELIEILTLPDLQKRFLRSRWLDQVLWMERAADRSRIPYYVLRLTAIIGGVIVPALVSLSINDKLDIKVGGIAFVVSLLVAISVAVEGFFNYDERWRHYRRTVEGLKIEGWRFFQLSGPYRRYRSHRAAYSTFADRIEGIIQQELEVYITKVVQEREQEREESETS